jgi:hypothetical protein
MGLMPDRPATQFRQNSSFPIPMGLTTPIPVTTMLFIAYQDTGFIGGMQVPEEDVRQAAVICELTVYKTFAVFF